MWQAANYPRQPLGSTMKVLRPAPQVFAFYDGRIGGVRAYSDDSNWLDDGAYSLGVCSYAIVDGREALVYDPHISLPHARMVRQTLSDLGVTDIRVVLSHWHRDHIAGNEVFRDCEIIANVLTARALEEHRQSIESGDPPIKPLIFPTRMFEGMLGLRVGAVPVELRHVDIHSHDGTVMLLPRSGLLFAGDTLEDPVTYVAEPGRLAMHLEELRRMATWDIRRILPNHGAPDVIAAGGYDRGLLGATRLYVEKLLRVRSDPALAGEGLRTFAHEAFATGSISYFAPYETIHRRNVAAVAHAREDDR